jgi:hypothetical protein
MGCARNRGRPAIFAIGQAVRHKSRALKGKVLEVDGDTVYLEAENGVEMQFTLGDLEADAPPAPPEVRRAAPASRAAPAAPVAPAAPPPPSADAKDAELLARIPESVVGQAAVRFARDPGSRRNGWADADAREKLDWVSKTTGLTREQLATLVRTGKAKQIEVHAAMTGRPR